MRNLILVFDQGTTGSQAALYEAPTLALRAICKVDYPQIYPQPGWVEHDPAQIWASCLAALKQAKQQAHLGENEFSERLCCIGITNQRETTVAWNKNSSECAGNAIVWQDRRTSDTCSDLRAQATVKNLVETRTGLVLDPYFSATKMAWMLAHYPRAADWARKNELAFGTIDSFLISKLSGGSRHCTDHTNASRTMLYSLARGSFDPELLAVFGIPHATLPEIVPSQGIVAYTKSVPGIPDGVPISGILGDQQAALFGQDATAPGQGKITFGTGSFFLLNVGAHIPAAKDGILASVAYHDGSSRTFALEGSSFIAAAAVKYVRNVFGWIPNAAESEPLATNDPRDPNILFIPAFSGLGAPFWNPHAKAALLGLSQGSTRSQIMRAVLESIALQNVQLLELMRQQYDGAVSRIGVDGGASANNFLMQFQADMLGAVLTRPHNTETTSRGAAKAALLGINTTTVPAAALDREFRPHLATAERTQIYARWHRAAVAIDDFYR